MFHKNGTWPMMIAALLSLASYLLGSVPTGFVLVSLLHGKDIRKQGSGNIGATNVWRIYGATLGILTFMIDALKAAAAIFLVQVFWSDVSCKLLFFIGFFAFLGHVFSPWLNFKGGKGIATLFGWMLAWNAWIFIGMAAVWSFIYLLLRHSFIAGLACATYVAIGSIYFCFSVEIVTGALFLWAIVLYRHQKNIRDYMKKRANV
jgi:glycerol-3-phosphate acyltransferase PlsY